MVRTSPSSPSFLRLAVQVCFSTLLQLSTTVHQCSGEIINAEKPSGEEIQVHHNTERYLQDDNDNDVVLILVLTLVFLIILTVCSLWACYNLYTAFIKAVRIAKENVERDLAETYHGSSRNIPPRECTYEASYTLRGEDYIITLPRMLTLKFSNQETKDGDDDIERNIPRRTESRNRWYISGNGNSKHVSFTISEGEVCAATGQAYWIEKYPDRRWPTVSMGKFQPSNFESFKGSFRTLHDVHRYDRFVKKSGTTAADSQGPTSSSRPQQSRESQAARYGGHTNPLQNSQSPFATYGEA